MPKDIIKNKREPLLSILIDKKITIIYIIDYQMLIKQMRIITQILIYFEYNRIII